MADAIRIGNPGEFAELAPDYVNGLAQDKIFDVDLERQICWPKTKRASYFKATSGVDSMLGQAAFGTFNELKPVYCEPGCKGPVNKPLFNLLGIQFIRQVCGPTNPVNNLPGQA